MTVIRRFALQVAKLFALVEKKDALEQAFVKVKLQNEVLLISPASH